MSQRSRAILKKFFETNDYPTQSQFADLIDSCLNFTDDGTPASADVNVKVTTADNTANKLNNKIAVTSSLTKEIINAAANEQLRFDIAATITGVKTFGSFPVSPSAAPTTDYQFANKKYTDDNFEEIIERPGTQPAISAGTLTLNCNSRKQAIFEPRLSVGTLTINENFTLAFSNEANIDLVSSTFSLTGERIITVPNDVMVSNASTIGTWNSGAHTLTLDTGTDDIIEFQFLRYKT
ncbi:unnamed protein product, partial [marine sediment metagenome]